MNVLVTGASGFVGRHVLAALAERGHVAWPCDRPGDPRPTWATQGDAAQLQWTPVELSDGESVAAAAALPCDAVVHLAAMASGQAARRDPAQAWVVNAAGTARLAEALALSARKPLTLVISTGEVYGAGAGRPRREDDPVEPVSPYAASKAGAEVAAREVARRTGLPVMVARSFAHTGPGQAEAYVVPAFVRRLREARAAGRHEIETGNLAPIRDFLDVRDVAAAYVSLLEHGEAGGTYNVASGRGISLAELFARLARLLQVDVEPRETAALMRASDIAHLVGDAARLRAATGWSPRIPLDQTLRDMVHAEAD
jgi:GDP-4-dehydro-6-deoxy-D-mannose reductase